MPRGEKIIVTRWADDRLSAQTWGFEVRPVDQFGGPLPDGYVLPVTVRLNSYGRWERATKRHKLALVEDGSARVWGASYPHNPRGPYKMDVPAWVGWHIPRRYEWDDCRSAKRAPTMPPLPDEVVEEVRRRVVVNVERLAGADLPSWEIKG